MGGQTEIFRASIRVELKTGDHAALLLGCQKYTAVGQLASCIRSGVGFESVAMDITGLYSPPETEVEGPEIGEVISTSIGIAGSAASTIPVGGSQISGTVSVVLGTEKLAEELGRTSGGAPLYDSRTFDGDVYKWGAELEETSVKGVTALRTVGNQIVSDQGRLEEMAALLDTLGSKGGFQVLIGEEEELIFAIERSEAKYLWSTMLPVPVFFFAGICDPPIEIAGGANINAIGYPQPTEEQQVTGVELPLSLVFNTNLVGFVHTGDLEPLEAETRETLFRPLPSATTHPTNPAA